MRLNEKMEKFYLGILGYAGIELDEEENFRDKGGRVGDISLDDKPITLPYMDSLKKPEGRAFFHLLNENYTSPETAMFLLYKRKLTLEINMRLGSLFIALISVAVDPALQRKVKSTELVNVITELGEMDVSILEGLTKAIKASTKENGEGYLVDFFLKKNGSINDVPYAAIGKVNFKLFNEVNANLTSGDYQIFGTKVRKKDLMALYALHLAVFPDLADDNYTEGTDNKVFRYLDILLSTSYLVSERIDQLAALLDAIKEPSLMVEEIGGDHSWTNQIQDLYGMANEIRFIPNQNDIKAESNRLKVDRSAASNVPVETPQQPQQSQIPQFSPQPVNTPQQPQQPQQVQQQQAPMSAEDIIRAKSNGTYVPQQQMNMVPQMHLTPQQQMLMQQGLNPMMVQQPQQHVPGWMAQEIQAQSFQQAQQQGMSPQQQQLLLQQQMLQQQMLQQQQQQMYQQVPMNGYYQQQRYAHSPF